MYIKKKITWERKKYMTWKHFLTIIDKPWDCIQNNVDSEKCYHEDNTLMQWTLHSADLTSHKERRSTESKKMNYKKWYYLIKMNKNVSFNRSEPNLNYSVTAKVSGLIMRLTSINDSLQFVWVRLTTVFCHVDKRCNARNRKKYY